MPPPHPTPLNEKIPSKHESSNFWVIIVANQIFSLISRPFVSLTLSMIKMVNLPLRKQSLMREKNKKRYLHKHLLRRLVGGGVAESLAEKLLHVLNDTQSCNCSVITRRQRSLRPLDGGYPLHVWPA